MKKEAELCEQQKSQRRNEILEISMERQGKGPHGR
jgi:hypothetical protein